MTPFARELLTYIKHDPMFKREHCADGEFRVDRLAAECDVDADEVRLWALGKEEPAVWQQALLMALIRKE